VSGFFGNLERHAVWVVDFIVTSYWYCFGVAGLACGRRPSESDVYDIQMQRKTGAVHNIFVSSTVALFWK
jgi:hypothetical protein